MTADKSERVLGLGRWHDALYYIIGVPDRKTFRLVPEDKDGRVRRAPRREVTIVANYAREGRTFLLASIRAEQAQEAAYDEALAGIPADYRRRHGAAYGGSWRIDGDGGEEPRMRAALPQRIEWTEIARAQKLGKGTGRVADQRILYRCELPDGRFAYRECSSRGHGDDLRETYWLPADVWALAMSAEVAQLGITRESAIEWLGKYRGCVGTELYEFAAESGNALSIASRTQIGGT